MSPVAINVHNSGKKKDMNMSLPIKDSLTVLQFQLALSQTKIKTMLRVRADDTGLLRCAVLT